MEQSIGKSSPHDFNMMGMFWGYDQASSLSSSVGHSTAEPSHTFSNEDPSLRHRLAGEDGRRGAVVSRLTQTQRPVTKTRHLVVPHT